MTRPSLLSRFYNDLVDVGPLVIKCRNNLTHHSALKGYDSTVKIRKDIMTTVLTCETFTLTGHHLRPLKCREAQVPDLHIEHILQVTLYTQINSMMQQT